MEMTTEKKSVSGAVASGVICFGVGIVVGILASTYYQAKWPTPFGPTSPPDGYAAQPITLPTNPKGGPNPGMRGSMAKIQLAALVDKLDALTSKPLAINLSEEQRKKLKEQLQGLDDKTELSEEDAKKRLDAVLEILQGDKETLEAAGYRWPGQAGGSPPPPADAANPFKTEPTSKHLKSLSATLSK